MHIGEEGRRTSFLFRKHPILPGEIDEFEFIDFYANRIFFHLFEEPADTVAWLKIKQPGTYTIHFDLIIDPNSFFILSAGTKTYFL